jgi:hypothetical protein
MTGSAKSLGKLLVAILSVVAVTAATPPSEPALACGAAEAAWVQENLETLPRTLSGFSKHSLGYRKAIYRALPGDVKAQLWREQLAHFASAASLSGEQKALLGEVAASLTNFDDETVLNSLLDKYETRIRKSFSKDQIGEIFTNLGVGDPSVAGRPTAVNSGGCSCHSGGIDVGACGPSGPPGTIFVAAGGCAWKSPCNPDSSGCGWFWLQSCNGSCG